MLDVRRQDLSLRTLRFEAADTGKSFTRNAPICARGEDVPLAAWPETDGSGPSRGRKAEGPVSSAVEATSSSKTRQVSESSTAPGIARPPDCRARTPDRPV